MRRTGDELPERMKVRERRARGVVVMRGAIMHVARDKDDIADAFVADELEQRRNLELAAERRPLVAVGDASNSEPSVTVRPSGMSLAMIFHAARDAFNRRFSHSTCAPPRTTDSSLSVACPMALSGPR